MNKSHVPTSEEMKKLASFISKDTWDYLCRDPEFTRLLLNDLEACANLVNQRLGKKLMPKEAYDYAH